MSLTAFNRLRREQQKQSVADEVEPVSDKPKATKPAKTKTPKPETKPEE